MLTGKLASTLFKDEINDRHREILEAAAVLFAERGYAATSVRDIGERVGLLGGSLYHYIKSKEALFVKIHDIALQVAEDMIRVAIQETEDPWKRLSAAVVTMLEIQLDPDSLTMPLMSDFQSVPPVVRERLVTKRDAFEQIFVQLVDDLPLAPNLDRRIYRLLLLTLLNNVSSWYRQGRLTPYDIARQIVSVFYHEVGSCGREMPAPINGHT